MAGSTRQGRALDVVLDIMIAWCLCYTTMPPTAAISIKQLHAKTGEWVRRAGKSKTPVPVTDRGRLVAVLAGPQLPVRRRQRTLLPAYAALLAKGPGHDVLADLAAVRGDR